MTKPLNIQTIHFTKAQISGFMRKHAAKENGLHDFMEIMHKSMMVVERSEFLHTNPQNKDNGEFAVILLVFTLYIITRMMMIFLLLVRRMYIYSQNMLEWGINNAYHPQKAL